MSYETLLHNKIEIICDAMHKPVKVIFKDDNHQPFGYEERTDRKQAPVVHILETTQPVDLKNDRDLQRMLISADTIFHYHGFEMTRLSNAMVNKPLADRFQAAIDANWSAKQLHLSRGDCAGGGYFP